MRMRRRIGLVAVLVMIVTGCAPTSRFPDIDQNLAEEEARRQRMEAVAEVVGQRIRLDEVSFHVLRANASLCGKNVIRRSGFAALAPDEYPKEWHEALRIQFGVGKTVTVVNVIEGSPAHRAGLAPRDRILEVGGVTINPGRRATRHLSKALASHKTGPIPLVVQRLSARRTLMLHPTTVCSPPVLLHSGDSVNAFTDGRRIVVTAGMMRFLTSDDDLALVVGHELAHVTRGHIEAQMGNQIIGAVLGAVFTGATGVDMTQTGADIGALAFSQEFEAEADYVGVYHAARAGYNVEKSAELWRRMARIHPKAINLIGSTHPSTAKRFLAIRAAAEEVENKRAVNKPLIPEEQ